MKRGQGRARRGQELIKGVYMDVSDEEEQKIFKNSYSPPHCEFAVAIATKVMVLTLSLKLWLLLLLV